MILGIVITIAVVIVLGGLLSFCIVVVRKDKYNLKVEQSRFSDLKNPITQSD